MRILVTFAIDNEFAPWQRMHDFRRAAVAQPSLYKSRIGSAEVRVLLTGIGAQHARRATQIALADGADVCISSGLAGALQLRHRIGDVVVARAVRSAGSEGFVKSDARLRHVATLCGAREVNAFLSTERAILTAKEKGRLAFSADAVEMESFAILSEAQAHRVPAVAVRAIGDTASQDLPLDFNRTVGKKGQVSIPRVFGQLARNPRRLPGLVRLSRDTQKAATRLGRFLDSFVELLVSGRTTEDLHEMVAFG
jgi:adenosylhomocysteine nucleosidase